MTEHDITYYSIEYRIAQKLQSLVVDGTSFFVASGNTLMEQCLLVEGDIVGIEPQDIIKGRKKLLLLAERELYAINDVVNPHTF